MNTFILFWNPKISSYTLERMRDDLEHWAHVSNWSVWQHDIAHKGDRFFMVRCGEGKTGICMSGRFRSEPYRDEDWSGKNREIYYMDLLADTVIDPDYLPILSTDELTKQIPSFDWSGGHSGRLLPKKDAEKLEEIWAGFLEQNKQIFNKLTLQFNVRDSYIFDTENETETYEADISFTNEGGFEIYDYDKDESVKNFDLEQLKKEFTQRIEAKGDNRNIEFRFEGVDDQKLFSKVLKIAQDAYVDMVDENGNGHFRRVIGEISHFYTDASMIVGLLQYVFKNPKITPDWLISQGIPKVIVDTIVVLQQKDGEESRRRRFRQDGRRKAQACGPHTRRGESGGGSRGRCRQRSRGGNRMGRGRGGRAARGGTCGRTRGRETQTPQSHCDRGYRPHEPHGR